MVGIWFYIWSNSAFRFFPFYSIQFMSVCKVILELSSSMFSDRIEVVVAQLGKLVSGDQEVMSSTPTYHVSI